MNHAYILTLSCPDRTGIVHAVSGFLLERGGNIEEAAQYNDHDTGLFFMRVRFACGQLTQEDLRTQLKMFAEGFQMQWKLHASAQPMKTVLFVSREGHCLNGSTTSCTPWSQAATLRTAWRCASSEKGEEAPCAGPTAISRTCASRTWLR